ncbi:hypothetical protein M406DRAFT_22037, partial [Cryphonectria parasitica EP155]
PPDLQVLCRRLASTDPDALPALCPNLISHIHRCRGVLSLVVDQKLKDSAPEHSVLVHKLKTQLTTLLKNGRSQSSRFSAAILIKAVVDVGGYECLRTSGPWVQGLLSIIQKNDPFPAREIAIITLTRIYTLLNEYQALVREIATPTLSAFVKACLQIVNPPGSSKVGSPPLRLVETVANALCTITPLYPTTLRPFSAQIKTTFRIYVAPTAADQSAVPQSLRVWSRKLFVLQHYTTPKNDNAEEWGKTIEGFIKSSHATADQVFRAVQESWESSSGYTRQKVGSEGEPHGGSDSFEHLPPWLGLSRGAERLIGLLETLSEFLKSPTKIPVTTPVSSLLDLTTRITLIVPPLQKGARSQDGTQLNSAIGREEKDELWTALPDIQTAVMSVLISLIQRLQDNAVPIAADMLHQTIRILDAHDQVPIVREHVYVLAHRLLLLHGPTMPKLSVNSLDKLIQSCCRDLLTASGHARPKASPQDVKPANSKASSVKPSSNADAYLTIRSKASSVAVTDVSKPHLEAASFLLATFLSHLPQQHLKQTLRALVDRTAVLSHNKEAMVASVLNPYRTRTGKLLASVFPFLSRDFPRDREVEVLRSNLRTDKAATISTGDGEDDEEVLEKMQNGGEDAEEDLEVDAEEDGLDVGEEEEEEDQDEEMADAEA